MNKYARVAWGAVVQVLSERNRSHAKHAQYATVKCIKCIHTHANIIVSHNNSRMQI